MKLIENERFGEERALYGSFGLRVKNCRFDGPEDGESAFKESGDIHAEGCYFNLRYPFWHDRNVHISNSEMTENCRAALWYTDDVRISNTKMHGIKALRECSDAYIENCDIVSPEFGWFSNGVTMKNTSVKSEYFMLRAKGLCFEKVALNGKYSLQYVENSSFIDCNFDTKDSLWHAKNIVVKNTVLRGEYLGWYCENVTFENCVIIGTQPLCYCRGLTLINCEMHECDLSFEKSEVNADIVSHVVSIKNPGAGSIKLPSVGDIIIDDPASRAEITVG